MTHETTRPGQAELRQFIKGWQAGRGQGKYLTGIEHIPPRPASFGPFPKKLDPRLQDMLRARGFSSLYTHQSQAISHALGGRHTVVVTPTASGKSLCYNLPVLDALFRGKSALYLFPTKALSQDQCAELNTLIKRTPGADASWEAQVYDGDTPSDVRRRIRQHGRLIITNPDMLHSALLPHHDKWAAFFRNLDYIVIDELHTYRGVFGSHFANVLRRLLRIAAHYGVQPTIVATSATIANPGELAQNLTGLRFEVVDQSGAPSGERYLCFLNPPIVDVEKMRRKGALSVAGSIARDVLKQGSGTIVFARSRQSVEVLVHKLKDRLRRDREAGDLADRVSSYRGGYLPELRRSIEKGLREGYVKGVISTNALELGIDIGGLDVCLLAGYPGTIASTWQQVGRAGRAGLRNNTSLAVLIASDDPIDQFIINHPEYFLGQSPEEARIDPANLLIAVEHLKCACFELPWRDGEAFGALTASDTTEALEFLASEMGIVQRTGQRWSWCADTYPAAEVNLRNIAEENFVVIDLTASSPNVLAEVDFDSAHLTIYPNAVYQVSGEPYRVERLDYDARRAYVRRSNDGYYTTAMHYSAVQMLDVFRERTVRSANIGFGEVCVTQRFVGYKKIKFGTGENVGYGELHLPELDLHTMAYWLELPTAHFEQPVSRQIADEWPRVIHGLGNVLLTAAGLKLMCDPRDLKLVIGSVSQDHWLSEDFQGLTIRDSAGTEHSFGAQPVAATTPNATSIATAHHSIQSETVGPVLFDPHIFIYDRYPGGVGFGEGLFDHHEDFLDMAASLVAACPCDHGCPSCIGPPDPALRPLKHDVAELLARLR